MTKTHAALLTLLLAGGACSGVSAWANKCVYDRWEIRLVSVAVGDVGTSDKEMEPARWLAQGYFEERLGGDNPGGLIFALVSQDTGSGSGESFDLRQVDP
ncbi:hypothetical protein L6R53_32920 [Myxococcota bacterium]|nr:hypothetical protein [Myxococcota bacterium]